MSGFRWQSVDDFVGEALGEKWAEKRLDPFPVPRLFMDFFTVERRWKDSADVDLERVKGTFHPDYVGMRWGEFLQKGKRMVAVRRRTGTFEGGIRGRWQG